MRSFFLYLFPGNQDDRKIDWLYIGLILLIALALRVAGTSFGLPGTFHPDEPHHINTAVYFGSGDLNPHVFKYPTLWMYFLFIL